MKTDIVLSENLPNFLDALLEDIAITLAAHGIEDHRAVSICIFNNIEGGQMQYISNAKREEVATAYKCLLGKWENDKNDIPYHQQGGSS